jgi:hypothetical protein
MTKNILDNAVKHALTRKEVSTAALQRSQVEVLTTAMDDTMHAQGPATGPAIKVVPATIVHIELPAP